MALLFKFKSAKLHSQAFKMFTGIIENTGVVAQITAQGHQLFPKTNLSVLPLFYEFLSGLLQGYILK